MKDKKYNQTIIYFVLIVYLELIYRIFTFGLGGLFNTATIYMIIFAFITSIIFSMISKAFHKKTNRIIFYLLTSLCIIYYFASFVFKRLFNTFFSIHLLKVSDQAVAFMGSVIEEVLKNTPFLLLFILPLIFIIRYHKKINFHHLKKPKIWFRNIFLLITSILIFVLLVNVNQETNNLFYKIDNNALTIEKMGVNVATYLDIKRVFIPLKEQVDVEIEENSLEVIKDEEKIVEYNNMDINFDELINNESNKTIKQMHEYFKSDSGTNKNDMTGLFKDKNLIVIMGESLNSIAISEQYTPTLYKLSHEGFDFTNFYTPVNLSTLGGEYQNLTALFADLSVLSNEWRKGHNYYPFGLGNIYNNLGYNTYAYHANYGTFQDRTNYIKNIGIKNFLYRGNGLEKKMNCNIWPQSDEDMVNVTYEDWINDEHFMTYYISVSGHMPWSWSANAMSKKNKDLLKDSNLSEEAAAYIAANIDLDKAVESLIQKLEEKGKLDDTVIAIVPDHYPYSMNIKTINELSTYQRDTKFEVNHSSLILWNKNVEHKEINKISSQLDFIPTLYNLFGIEYDSRLLMGKDIFSDSLGLVYFTDRSWISDLGRYNASNQTFTKVSDDTEVPENYVQSINKIVNNRISMSKLIMQNNYYKIVLGSD